jgi:hypothetical protein
MVSRIFAVVCRDASVMFGQEKISIWTCRELQGLKPPLLVLVYVAPKGATYKASRVANSNCQFLKQPQRLKPHSPRMIFGTAEAVP